MININSKYFKYCPKCKEVKPRSEFGLRKMPKGVFSRSHCKKCEGKQSSENYKKNPEYFSRFNKDYTFKRYYGITRDHYNQMLVEQDGKCAICKKPINDTKRRRNPIDHNHETGAVRGVLCYLCNNALGLFGENIESLKNAIEYLKYYDEHPREVHQKPRDTRKVRHLQLGTIG